MISRLVGRVRNQLAQPWVVVLVVGTFYLGAILVRNGGDPLAFAVVGTRHQLGDPSGTEGYDGQFSYYIALDPVGAGGKLDVPAYRYQRILYPMLARWVGLGRPSWIPWTLLLVNLAALVAGTVAVEGLMSQFRVSRWYALVYGLYAGLLMSVRLDLGEPLAYGLTMAACWTFERKRPHRAAALFALAALAKEITLVFAVAYGLYVLLTDERRVALKFGLVAAGPFALWQIVLWLWMGSPGIGSGGAMATPFEIVPLMGLWRIGAVSPAALLLYAAILGPLVVLPTLWALWSAGRELVRGRWHPLSLALFLNAAVLLFLPHSSWREFLAMLRLSVGLMAAFLLYAGLRQKRRALGFSFAWLAALAFLAKEGPVL